MTEQDVFDIYYDSLTEADWFSSLHPAFDLDANRYHIIQRRGSNPALIEEITQYDKPDIILVKNGRPLLVIEVTQEVPSGHNVGQRFARLVRAIELGIPAMYFFPFDAKKHGENATICHMNIRLLEAARNMYRIHGTPLLCVNWPTDRRGEIIVDGSENSTIAGIIKSYVDSGFDTACAGFMDHMKQLDMEYARRLRSWPAYAGLPSSVTREETASLLRRYGIGDAPEAFRNRPYTYVYRMNMAPNACRRQDPYTGTAFIYDYLACRTGNAVGDKKSNLVFHFPKVTVATWRASNPNNPATKSSNWYLTANLFILKDGIIWVRE